MHALPVTRRFVVSMLNSSVWWAALATALSCAYLAGDVVEKKTRVEFDSLAASAVLAIESGLRSHADALRGAGALFYTDNNLSRAQFHAYVARLDLAHQLPSVVHLYYVRQLAHEARAGFLTQLHKDDVLAGNDQSELSIQPPGDRAEYQVLAYKEPATDDGFARGLDFAADADLLRTLIEARDSGTISASYHTFGQAATNPRTMLAMQLPLYRAGLPVTTIEERRAAYTGAVGAVIDLAGLVDGALDRRVHPALALQIHNAGARLAPLPGRDSLLYVSGGSASEAMESERFIRSSTIEVGSGWWRVEFSAPKSSLLTRFDAWLPALVLFAGLTGSVLLYGAYYALTTARRRATELAEDMTRDLRASKTSLAEAQQMARLGSWVLDPEDDSMTWSEETFHLFGMHRYSIRPTLDDFARRVHEEDRERVVTGLRHALWSGSEFRTEHRIRQRGLGMRWVQLISRPAREGNRTLLRGAMMDITERKQTMEALRRSQELLRDLTSHQERVREDERRRIAREIHDELGQTLLALRIDVSMLEARTREQHPRLNHRVRDALQQLDATVRTIRNIINNLRPAVLDLGLAAAMEWQVKEFRRRSGLVCELHLGAGVGADDLQDPDDRSAEPELQLDDVRATTLFRILQESLTNVIRHAQATRVVIELRRERQRLVMTISDNGIGMRREARRPENSFGLIGVEERVHALHGEFRIDSAAGEGTRLTIFIPLETGKSSPLLAADAGVS